MNAKIFYDTNILVYAFTRANPAKQAMAVDLIESGMRYGIGVISTQVVNEFIAVMTGKLKPPVPMKHMKYELEALSGLEIVEIDMPQILKAVEISNRNKISFWDALVIVSAEHAGCRTLLTEDLNHGQKFGTLQVVNPFLA